jgi:hypothetical protein
MLEPYVAVAMMQGPGGRVVVATEVVELVATVVDEAWLVVLVWLVVVELEVVDEVRLLVVVELAALLVVDEVVVLVVIICPVKDRSSDGHGLGAQPRRLRSSMDVWLATR